MITNVTDPVVISALERVKIDASDVSFARDYCAQTPYAKTYINERTRNLIQVICGLPMARKTDGSLLTPGWSQYGGSLVAKTNLFDGEIAGTRVALSAVNAQPSGALTGDYATWNPTLRVGGEVVEPVDGPYLLEVDPLNPNYEENTVEWDYGVCKRRVRVIEGRFRERWIFSENPGANVQIEHGFEGDLPIILGKGSPFLGIQVDDDMELVTAEAFDLAFAMHGSAEIGASGTFYPDADTESKTVDGYVWWDGWNTWANVRTASSGTGAYDSHFAVALMYIKTSGVSNEWINNSRGFFLYDTSSIGSGSTITSATQSFYGHSSTDNWATPSFSCRTFSSNPASNTSLSVDDYDQVGTTLFDSTGIPILSLNTSGYNNLPLNAAGLAAINKSGITKFSVYNSEFDALNGSLNWENSKTAYCYVYSADKGSGYKPKLVVNYALPYKGQIFGNHYRRRRA